jgi:hypothetical protein
MSFSSCILRILLVAPLVLIFWQAAAAQQQEPAENNSQIPFPKSEDICDKTGDVIKDELRLRQCFKRQQSEYDDLLENGNEAVKLSTELEKSVDKAAGLASDDQKKLERLEKLFKKIRSSLGGDDDDPTPDEDKPMSVKAAVLSLNEKAVSLLSELKKTTRYSISVAAIHSSNAIIRLVKFIRIGKN